MSMSESWPEAEAAVPAPEETDELVELTLRADTLYTEIRLLDARFTPVTLSANTGQVVVSVSPGLYEVGFRTAEGWQSQHVIVNPESDSLVVEQEPSTVAAPDMVSPPQSFIDDEATVVIDLNPPADAAGLPGSSPSAIDDISVTLTSATEPTPSARDLQREATGLWRFVAKPGYWRLRISEAHPRQPFEIAITVVSNYIAYITAPVRPAEGGACVDLERFRFRLLPAGSTAAPSGDLIGFEETAFAALNANRPLFGPALERLIDDLVDDKALNPMLGILAGHLCHKDRDGALVFQDRLLGWLESVTGGHAYHPDVYALRIGFMMRTGGALQGLPPFPFPPILAASWRVLVEASKLEPGLVPVGSLGDLIADRLWASAQWVAWTAPPVEAGTVEVEAPATTASRLRKTATAPVKRAVRSASRIKRAAPAAKSAARRAAPKATYSVDTSGGGAAAANPPLAGSAGGAVGSIRSPAANTAVIEAGLAHSELRDWVRIASGEDSRSNDGIAWLSEQGITPAEIAIASAVYPLAPTEELQSVIAKFAKGFRQSRSRGSLPTALERTDALGLPQATIERALDSFASKLVDHAAKFNIKL